MTKEKYLTELLAGFTAKSEDPKFDYSVGSWRRQTVESLNAHLIEEHLHPSSLAFCGIPRYDIEVAAHTRLDLSPYAEEAYRRLERTDTELRAELGLCGFSSQLTPASYRLLIVKSLRYAQEKNGQAINWDRIEKIMPQARSVVVNLEIDAKDPEFNPE